MVLICIEGIVMMGVCLRRFCLNMSVFVCSELGPGCSGECCFGVMYGELFGVCGFLRLVLFVV